MSSYLERYQQGETVQVWKELVELGDEVRTQPLYDDAWAVAQETMHRAKHNIELIIKRLKEIDYWFADPKYIMLPTDPERLDELDRFEREVGYVPLSLRAWMQIVGTVNLIGAYPRLACYADDSNPTFAIGGPGGEIEILDLDSMLQQGVESGFISDELKHAMKNLHSMMQSFKPQLPEEKKQIPYEDQVASDPLVIEPVELSVEEYHFFLEENDEERYFLSISPDVIHKANESGGGPYGIYLPDSGADAQFHETDWGEITFVEYLRFSFEWGGFPGLKNYERRDEQLLTSLKEGFLPL